MSTGPKIALTKALPIAQRFLKLVGPFVEKAEIAGSVRRQCREVGDIEIVVVENPLNTLDNLFYDGYPGMVVNGKRLKRFKYPKSNVQVELYIAQPYDYGRILAIRTGSSFYSHHQLATAWFRNGWTGTLDGLRRRTECVKKGKKWILKSEFKNNPTKPPVFATEYDFFNFLGTKWKPPEQRNWISRNPIFNYSR